MVDGGSRLGHKEEAMAKSSKFSSELDALSAVLTALDPLEGGQQLWVLTTAAGKLGVGLEESSSQTSRPASLRTTESAAARANSSGGEAPSPKEFMRVKNPQTEVEKVLCLGHYLTAYRAQPHFKTRDLTALNQEAACPRLTNPSQAVANATKQSQYLASAGGGNKQVTALGEEIVEALPDREAMALVVSQRRAGRKKVVRKKADRTARRKG